MTTPGVVTVTTDWGLLWLSDTTQYDVMLGRVKLDFTSSSWLDQIDWGREREYCLDLVKKRPGEYYAFRRQVTAAVLVDVTREH